MTQRPRKAVTVLFCLQMGFTAYAQLSVPQVAEAFTRPGFPDYFRLELAWAKLLGVILDPVGPLVLLLERSLTQRVTRPCRQRKRQSDNCPIDNARNC
jgi:hypothetical protein